MDLNTAQEIATAAWQLMDRNKAYVDRDRTEDLADALVERRPLDVLLMRHDTLRRIRVLGAPDLTGRTIHIIRCSALTRAEQYVDEGFTTQLAITVFKVGAGAVARELTSPRMRRAWIAALALRKWAKQHDEEVDMATLNGIVRGWMREGVSGWVSGAPNLFEVITHQPDQAGNIVTVQRTEHRVNPALTASANAAVFEALNDRGIDGKPRKKGPLAS